MPSLELRFFPLSLTPDLIITSYSIHYTKLYDTPTDNNVWVAGSTSNEVVRLSNTGAVLAQIPVGATPTGLAVDDRPRRQRAGALLPGLHDRRAVRLDRAGPDRGPGVREGLDPVVVGVRHVDGVLVVGA